MKNQALVTWTYAAIVAVVGTLGYVLKQSVPSIIAGLVAGALLAVAGRGISTGKSWGFLMALMVTVALLLNFAGRFGAKGGFWPNGLMALVSVAALAALIMSGKRPRRQMP